MKKLFYIMLVVSVVLVSQNVFAENTRVWVDLEKLTPAARNEILDLQKGTRVSDPDQWKKWSEIGKGIGLAIGETAKVLNTEVNAFIKTPAGMITVGLIAYKVIGTDVKRIVLGIPIWIVLLTLIILSFRKFHMNERFAVRDDKNQITNIKYIPRFDFKSSDAKVASAISHGGAFFILNLAMALVIL